MLNRLIRTAFSLFAVSVFASPAVAQQPIYPNSPFQRTTVSPWPGTNPRLNPPSVPPAPLPWVMNQPQPETRTVYYKKETNRSGVRQTGAADLQAPMPSQQPMRPSEPSKGMSEELNINPRVPGPEGVPPLFRLESEENLVARENAERPKKRPPLEQIIFPVHAPNSLTPFVMRALAPNQTVVEPNYVVYRRLLFEDKNSERYGWSMGALQPLVDVGNFASNVSNLPYNFFSFPGLWFDSSAGLCLPGDPVPYLLYPPGFSVSGFLGQAGVTVALYAIFP